MKFVDSVCVAILIATIFQGSTSAQSSAKDSETTTAVVETQLGDEFTPTKVLALVGGEPIFVGDVLFEVNQLIARFMPNAPVELVRRERGSLLRRMLPKYIEQKMLLIDVKGDLPPEADFEELIESASSEFDEKALSGMMESAGVDSTVLFDAHLRAQGSSLRKLRKSWTTNQVVRFFLTQKITSDAEVSHKELLEYYQAHISEYEFKAKARWEQVMVRHSRFSSTSEAMAAIVEMGNKIVYGASMNGVAKKSSQGYRASTGGEHDWTTKGALVLKEIDAAIFSLPVGQLSDIIKTKDGFHVVRVLEREDAGKLDFVEAQVEIRKKLESERRVAAYDEHLAKLKELIPVEIMSPEGAPQRVASKGSDTKH